MMKSWKKTLAVLGTLGILSVAGACGNGDNSPNPTPTPTPTPSPLALNFGTPLTLDMGTEVPGKAQAVVVGNFTDDSNLDFAVLNERFGVFVGNGDGTFQDRQDATPPKSGPTALTLGQFDTTNNNIEIIVSYGASDTVDIYEDPERDGSFEGTNFDGGTSPQGVAVADFNNDGLNDIALIYPTNNMRVKINDGVGGFTDLDFDTDSLLLSGKNLVAGDFNGDDFPDVAITEFDGGKLIVWINSGNAGDLFPNGNATALDLPAGSGVQGVTTADFNKDGFDDLVAPNPGTKNISVFINNGNGTFGPITNYPAGNDPFGAGVGDFNLDSHLDIVVANAFGVDGTNGDFSVYLGDGKGSFAEPKTFTAGAKAPTEPNHPRSVAVGDFNGDGKPDVVMSSDLVNTAVVVLNTSN